MRTLVGDTTNRRFAERVRAPSVTLVRDDAPRLSEGPQPTRRILHVVIARRTSLGDGSAFARAQGRTAGRVRTVVVHPDDPFVDPARILPQVDSSEIVLLASFMAQPWDVASAATPDGLGARVTAIRQHGKPRVMIGFGNPDFGAQVPQAGSYLIAWNGSRAPQVAAARALLGQQPFNRYIPITMSPAGPVPAGGTPR